MLGSINNNNYINGLFKFIFSCSTYMELGKGLSELNDLSGRAKSFSFYFQLTAVHPWRVRVPETLHLCMTMLETYPTILTKLTSVIQVRFHSRQNETNIHKFFCILGKFFDLNQTSTNVGGSTSSSGGSTSSSSNLGILRSSVSSVNGGCSSPGATSTTNSLPTKSPTCSLSDVNGKDSVRTAVITNLRWN